MGGEEERMMERDSMITMTERHSHAERIIKIPGNGLGSLEQWGSTCEFCGKGLLGCLLEQSLKLQENWSLLFKPTQRR